MNCYILLVGTVHCTMYLALTYSFHEFSVLLSIKRSGFKRRILHAPNQILILVDLNEYVRLISFKRRIVLPNKIAEGERRVLNSQSSEHNYLT